MTKLLNRPLKAFTVYALIILLISVPVYVLVVDHIWVTELDENNWLNLQYTKQRLQAGDYSNADLERINQLWAELHPGVSIAKSHSSSIRPDSVYEIARPNEYDSGDEEERFRGLKSDFFINGEIYQITIETNVEEVDETLLAIAIVTFCFFMVLVVGFIVLNRKISASSWRPFYEILRSLQAFDLAKGEELKLSPVDIQEFEELNQSLQLLVRNNIAAYQQQKSFTENASHELQTPLALLRSKLDLLIQQKGITPEIREILSGIEAPLSRLSRINKNLLVLAKVEHHQYREWQKLDVENVLESSLELFEDYIADRNLVVTKQVQDTISVQANSFLLETLVHNILSNAIRHSSPGARIQIRQENRTLYIGNSGDAALDEKHLFERFSRSSKDKVSSGLGLAIIKEIATKYSWQPDYHFDHGSHWFSVSF